MKWRYRSVLVKVKVKHNEPMETPGLFKSNKRSTEFLCSAVPRQVSQMLLLGLEEIPLFEFYLNIPH